MKLKKQRRMKPIQIIALGIACLILIGALLLSLPLSSSSGNSTDFVSALFTATSATCVTGLVVQDTAMHWSMFGQCVILVLIQIGGLGFMTVAALISMILKRKITLQERGILRESVNIDHLGGVVKLTRKVLLGTVIVEGAGALLLMLRFIPSFGVSHGIYMSVFHSVSAFCNAGFDLMGSVSGEYSSLTAYDGDLLVNVTIMLLIIIGGIGFIVWSDLAEHRWHFKRYMVHTKIVLVVSGVLLLLGALLFYVFERNNLFSDMSVGEGLLAALFESTTTRTAGFNTVDISKMSGSSQLLNMILMFIGGSPGSTAGGIKTTTFFVMLLALASSLRNSHQLNTFRRRLEPDATRKALCVFVNNMTMAIVAAFIICSTQGMDIVSVLVETFSAISTVGMTTGITRELSVLSRLIIMVLMYCGRVGSLTFAMSFSENKTGGAMLPETKINIG